MNENIDLGKILKDCPKWTPFYSQVFGKVFFIRIETCLSGKYVVFALLNNGIFSVDSKGKYANGDNPKDIECIIFLSKEQRDWRKFTAPWYKNDKTEKFDPKTLQPFDKVLVRDTADFNWTCDLFSYILDGNVEYKYKGVGCLNKYCIPYNDDTKHLLGTTDEAPEFYKYWDDYKYGDCKQF